MPAQGEKINSLVKKSTNQNKRYWELYMANPIGKANKFIFVSSFNWTKCSTNYNHACYKTAATIKRTKQTKTKETAQSAIIGNT